MVSGGSTPAPVFDQLSGMELGWPHITIGLVDERWVGPDSSASNERLARAHLLKDKAADSEFLPMWTPDADVESAAKERSNLYTSRAMPIGLAFLGMGPDGHTASWFPGARNLQDAIGSDVKQTVVHIDATGCPVAGENADRLTLTLPAIAESRSAYLLICGQEKRDVFEAALIGSAEEFPVKYAIDALGSKLKVYWAP